MTTRIDAPRFRRESLRTDELFGAYKHRVTEVARHILSEALEHAVLLFGESDLAKVSADEATSAPYSYAGRRATMAERAKQFTARADLYAWHAKRLPIKVTAPIPFDGELNPLFGKVYKEIVIAQKRPAGPARVRLTRGAQVIFAWGTGSYKIHREVFVPAGSEFTEFEGDLVIDEALLRRGGPFRLELRDGELHMLSLVAVTAKWKLALHLMRGKYGRRVARRSLHYRDVVHRLRTGAELSMEKCSARDATLILVAGREKPAWLAGLKREVDALRARAAKICDFADRLKAYAEACADAFISDPLRMAENTRRELTSAQAAFTEASEALFREMAEAVAKAERPLAPYTERPESVPLAKRSAGKNISRRYEFRRGAFWKACERLTDARAAAAALPVEAPPAPLPVALPLEATEVVVAPVALCGTQEMLAL